MAQSVSSRSIERKINQGIRELPRAPIRIDGTIFQRPYEDRIFSSVNPYRDHPDYPPSLRLPFIHRYTSRHGLFVGPLDVNAQWAAVTGDVAVDIVKVRESDRLETSMTRVEESAQVDEAMRRHLRRGLNRINILRTPDLKRRRLAEAEIVSHRIKNTSAAVIGRQDARRGIWIADSTDNLITTPHVRVFYIIENLKNEEGLHTRMEGATPMPIMQTRDTQYRLDVDQYDVNNWVRFVQEGDFV